MIVSLLLFLGFGALAATMHATPARLRLSTSRRKPATAIGWCLIALSLIVAVLEADPGLGLVQWTGLATIAALAIVAVVTIARPGRR